MPCAGCVPRSSYGNPYPSYWGGCVRQTWIPPMQWGAWGPYYQKTPPCGPTPNVTMPCAQMTYPAPPYIGCCGGRRR